MNDPTVPDDDGLIQTLRRAMRDPEPPRHVVAAAIGVWKERPAKASALGHLIRVMAELVFDSHLQSPVALGLRSTAADVRVRHLLFSAQGRDVDIRVIADLSVVPQRWTMGGQVLGPDSSGTITAAREGGESQSVPLDAMGEFSVGGLAAGRYVVTFVCGSTEIVLPAIDIGTNR
jgi:hypothetical protein